MAVINGTIGAYAGSTITSTTEGQDHALGDMAFGDDGSIWVYVQANGAISQYDVVLLDEDWQADQIDTTNTASARGQLCGVAAVAFADDAYGWIQICGVTTMNVKKSCAANAVLNSTASAGRLDDDSTTGAEVINGIVLTTLRGSTSGSAAGILFWPTVGATET